MKAKLGAQTSGGFPYGQGQSSALAWTPALNDGEFIIGATGGNPAPGTITAGSGVTVTPSANGITVGLTGSGVSIDTLVPNSGINVVPDGSGNVTSVGTGSITTVGTANTLTIQLTGLTNHSLLVGAGTATITNLGVATNGQLPIGSTGADPVLATLTAGTGVTITNGAGSITIDAEGGGLTWSEETSTPLSGAVGHGYIVNNAGLFTINLPGTFAIGDVIAIVGKGAGLWVIDAPAGDTVNFGNQSTSAGGTVTATHRYDCLEIIGTIANDTWTVRSSIGNFTIA